ncbi:MAG TPA: DUF933 domain-containing protein [Dehalococcoidia bacterium]|nr:DUF933 domain-containing protein [Dehalococcoidia bacterium]
MNIALIGLPFSGTSSAFRALAAGHAQAGGRQQEHVAVVRLKDERLEKLAAHFRPRKATPPEVTLHDLPGLMGKRGEISGAGAATLAQSDVLVQVVRAFQREDLPHPEGSVDPARDIETLSLELTYFDLAVIERRLEKLDIQVRSARPGEREAGQREQSLFLRLKSSLESGEALRGTLSAEEEKSLAGFGLLTLKPLLLLLNINESDLPRLTEIERDYRERLEGPRTQVAALCASLEADLAELPAQEAAEFRLALGLTQPAAERVLSLLPGLLGLVAFYTLNAEECRAWQVAEGTPAQLAAGKIHSDMQRGFIRAEVIQWDRLLAVGSLAEARKQGVLRSEGKQYPVHDGDVMHVLFQV